VSIPLIVCASTQYWDETWFRKQHFMKRLSQHRPVLYVEPSRSILRPPRQGTPPTLRNPPFTSRLRTLQAGRLWTYTPPRGWPLWTHRRVSPLQYDAWGRAVRLTARDLGFERVWLWLYNPLWIQSTASLAPERVIFDLVDDLTAYDAGAHTRETMRVCVERALTESDLVFTTSKLLAETHASRTREGKMHVVSNGVPADWLSLEIDELPPQLAALPRPRIGFVGAVFSYLDADLLVATARAFRGGSLVVVGPVHDETMAARLRAEPNTHLLGAWPQARVPEAIAGFDVALSPFRAGAVRRAVNPLKVYEYLALGKPVVSTPLESLRGEPIADSIRMAESTPEFVRAIREALAQDNPAARMARRRAVAPYTWDALGEQVERILEASDLSREGERA